MQIKETTIDLHNIKGKVNETVTLTAILKDQTGNILANKEVNFYVNGVFFGSSITNSNGLATLKYKISIYFNELDIKGVFSGDDLFYGFDDLPILKIITNNNNNTNNTNNTNNSNNYNVLKSKITGPHITMAKTGIPLMALLSSLIAIVIESFVLFRKNRN